MACPVTVSHVRNSPVHLGIIAACAHLRHDASQSRVDDRRFPDRHCLPSWCADVMAMMHHVLGHVRRFPDCRQERTHAPSTHPLPWKRPETSGPSPHRQCPHLLHSPAASQSRVEDRRSPDRRQGHAQSSIHSRSEISGPKPWQVVYVYGFRCPPDSHGTSSVPSSRDIWRFPVPRPLKSYTYTLRACTMTGGLQSMAVSDRSPHGHIPVSGRGPAFSSPAPSEMSIRIRLRRLRCLETSSPLLPRAGVRLPRSSPSHDASRSWVMTGILQSRTRGIPNLSSIVVRKSPDPHCLPRLNSQRPPHSRLPASVWRYPVHHCITAGYI